MINFSELYHSGTKLDLDQLAHLSHLHHCLNFIRVLHNEPMVITRGYSTWDQHVKIYEAKNAQRARQGLPPVVPPKGSMHLLGAAADVFDPTKRLQHWILENLHVCEGLNLYFEEFEFTPNWVHIQTLPPRSGKRFFVPF